MLFSLSVDVHDQLVHQESSTKDAMSWKVYQQYCQAAGGLIQHTDIHALAVFCGTTRDFYMTDPADCCNCVATTGWIITSLCFLNVILMTGSTAFSSWWLSVWLRDGSGSAVRNMKYY